MSVQASRTLRMDGHRNMLFPRVILLRDDSTTTGIMSIGACVSNTC